MSTKSLVRLFAMAISFLYSPSLEPQIQPTIDRLLAKLKSGPVDQQDCFEIEAQPPDLRTLPALRSAFAERSKKEERQWIAVTLIRLGDKSILYFDYLAAFGRDAVDDDAPDFLKYDQKGELIRGEFSPDFLAWCKERGEDPKAAGTKRFLEYPSDLFALANAEDSRALAIFRKGLHSRNPSVVLLCVQGLGRLNDSTSLPVILLAARRLQYGPQIFGSQLPWFTDPQADKLMEILLPDARVQDYNRRTVAGARKLETERVLRREGRLPQK